MTLSKLCADDIRPADTLTLNAFCEETESVSLSLVDVISTVPDHGSSSGSQDSTLGLKYIMSQVVDASSPLYFLKG